MVTGTDGNGCTDTNLVVVTVNSCGTPPISGFGSSDSTLCVGDCIDFNDLSTGGPTNWTWYFFGADSTTSIQQNPTNICYNAAGTFDVALVSTNAFGQDSLYMPGFITVNALPTVVAGPDTTICSGDNANIYATGASSYSWDNALGAGQGHSVSPAMNTTYIVTGTDGNGCINTDSTVVTVNACGAPPVASFSATDSTICLGDCIDFSDLSTGVPTGWTWYFFGADSTTSAQQNPMNICYSSAGSFDVALVSSNSAGQDSLFIPGFITVNALPTIVAGPDTTICSGDNANIYATGASSYSWDNGLGSGQGHTVSPAMNTTYIVVGTDANGCMNQDTTIVSVNICAPPIASLSASSASICINECIDFTDLSTGGTPTSWTWYLFGANPNSSVVQDPANVCYDSTGTFDVALVVSNTFGQDSIYLANYITVDSCNTLPVSVIIPNVFSPNGDGQNDLFNVTGEGIISVKASIYNRWGSLMFSTEDLTNHGWDGRTTAGTECSEGTYFYLMEVETLNESETYKGTLTLIR
jgi:gliding motility-associated-like protein